MDPDLKFHYLEFPSGHLSETEVAEDNDKARETQDKNKLKTATKLVLFLCLVHIFVN